MLRSFGITAIARAWRHEWDVRSRDPGAASERGRRGPAFPIAGSSGRPLNAPRFPSRSSTPWFARTRISFSGEGYQRCHAAPRGRARRRPAFIKKSLRTCRVTRCGY